MNRMTELDVFDLSRRILYDAGLQSEEPTLARLIEGKLRNRDLPFLCELSHHIDPNSHGSQTVRTLLQIEGLFKKNKSFSDDERCRQAAKLSFLKAETNCRITNRRLEYYYLKRERLAPDLQLQCSRMESWIFRVLGSRRGFLDEMPRLMRLTSGATANSSRRNSFPHLKLGCWSGSPGALAVVDAVAQKLGYKPKLKLTQVNRVVFVPKNWKTYRTIAAEPNANIPVQLAFDSYAKSRLRSVGIDLSNQFINQEKARLGSIDGSYATVDIQTASDTIAVNAVAWFFPSDWFTLLNSFRSISYVSEVDGLSGVYAKFSSMGNGSTFTIETLLFAAACHAVGSKRFRVYGDDIIIEPKFVKPLYRLLRFLGFRPNEAKSFSVGPFRESCGTAWWNGDLVTPFYLRSLPKGGPDWSHVINGLASVSKPFGKVWEFLLAKLRENKLPLVPFTESTTRGVWIDTASCYSLKVFKFRKSSWSMFYKGFVAKQPKFNIVDDSRTYFLWHWESFRCNKMHRPHDQILPPWLYGKAEMFLRDFGSSNEEGRQSRVRPPASGYRRRWCSWYLPAVSAPPHLDWWGEEITNLLS